MELETMFAEQKWNILRELATEPSSPLQLSEKLGTSMANISQQLRLLEVANLVEKRKIKNRDKGKPRSLFSLTRDHGYIIAATSGFANKQLVTLSEEKRAVMQIWFVGRTELHAPLQQAFWTLYSLFNQIGTLAILEYDSGVDLVVAAKKTAHKKIEAVVASLKNHGINVHIVENTGIDGVMAQVNPEQVYVLHSSAREL